MAFFDDLGKKLSQAGQNTIQKTKEIADIAKINALISTEEKKMEGIYLEIGKVYVENHSQDSEEIFKESIQALCSCKQNIENYQEEIRSIKGVKNCPNCGAEVASGAIFCAICGNEFPKTQIQIEVESLDKNCTNCGAQLECGAIFCAECGTKVEIEVQEGV